MKKYFLLAWVTLGIGFTACEDDEKAGDVGNVEVIEDSQPSAARPAKGFYVANEDWFGHDNGTVNYFKVNGNEYDVVYRAYRAANEDETLGVTTQFGTTWGNNIYLMSKQENRFVVADANTLRKKAVFTEIGGDGRSFVGVDDKTGYISHSNGVRQFDIVNLQLGDAVDGITQQVGAMCYAEGRVFALTPEKAYIIDVATNTVEKTLDGSFNTLTRSKDGTVWIATDDNFLKVNPQTLEEETMEYPEGMKVGSSWGAWNAGSLCAGTQTNTLYWTKSGWSSSIMVKYDIDTQSFNPAFYTLGKHENKQLTFYGAGVRVDPLTDRIVATVIRGYDYNYNWVQIINPDGTLEKEIEVKGGGETGESEYYWFPAVPFFEDANTPEILINQILLSPKETKTIDLREKIVDADNTSVSIIHQVEFADNKLVDYSLEAGILTVTAKENLGNTECKVIAISNGKRIEKKVRVDVALQ